MPEPRYKPPSLTAAHQLVLLMGVILPVVAITVEASTHICARTYFDPIPSVGYLVLVIFVPVAQLHVWFMIRRGTTQHLVLAGWLNAVSYGVSIFYAIVFMPLQPLAALIIVFVVGLLPLTPPLSLVAAILQRRHLQQIAANARQEFFIMRKIGLLAGLVIPAVFIGLLQLHASLTRCDLKLTASQSPERIDSPRKSEGLFLSKSRIYTKADANGGIAYSEWTLVFVNGSAQAREARAEVQLPPGAVVSRLTLWVNGDEHEATFVGRGEVNAPYQVGIGDPAVVSTSGRDRILVQCFLVPADNSEMKIRIGITIPLLLQDLNNAQLLLPHFIDRNFQIPVGFTHSVWIESKTSISSASSAFMTTDFTEDTFAHHGRIPEREMSNPRTTFLIARANVPTWSKDPFQTTNFMIRQSVEARRPEHLYRVVLVFDTSQGMQGLTYELSTALKSIPAGFDFKLVLAVDGGLFTASGVKEASALLRDATFGGDADNVAALIKAWDLATEKPGNNAIVWVHGPQVLQLHSAEDLKQRWQRGLYGPSLYSLQTRGGSDQILKTLDGINEVKSVTRTDELDIDLRRLFQQLTGQMTTLEWARTSKKVERLMYADEAIQTSDQLARLWANDEVARILAPGDESLNQAATMLAVRYQLVTPLTGAVVLKP